MYSALEKTMEINKFRDVVIPSRRELFERFGKSSIREPNYSIGASDDVVPPSRSNCTIDQLQELQCFLNSQDNQKEQ